jgi:rubrerythrin
VYDAINKVRERAGMPDIPKDLSKKEMREAIHHERRIEFAGEGYYYNDIRRWKTAEKVMNAPIKNWEGKVIETRSFDASRDYWWPIPVHQRDLNPNLEQNPNY